MNVPLNNAGVSLDRLEKAVLRLSGGRSRGVLLQPGVILTAAHSLPNQPEITWEWTGATEAEPPPAFSSQLLAIETVSDIALLGPPDSYEEPVRSEEYRRQCDAIEGLPLAVESPEPFVEFPIWILDHQNRWVEGSALSFGRDHPTLFACAPGPIEDSAAGGPIVNGCGDLVAVCTRFVAASSRFDRFSAIVARPHLCLPWWVGCQFFGFRLAKGQERRVVSMDLPSMSRAE